VELVFELRTLSLQIRHSTAWVIPSDLGLPFFIITEIPFAFSYVGALISWISHFLFSSFISLFWKNNSIQVAFGVWAKGR
jgi:hypothetical protein